MLFRVYKKRGMQTITTVANTAILRIGVLSLVLVCKYYPKINTWTYITDEIITKGCQFHFPKNRGKGKENKWDKSFKSVYQNIANPLIKEPLHSEILTVT